MGPTAAGPYRREPRSGGLRQVASPAEATRGVSEWSGQSIHKRANTSAQRERAAMGGGDSGRMASAVTAAHGAVVPADRDYRGHHQVCAELLRAAQADGTWALGLDHRSQRRAPDALRKGVAADRLPSSSNVLGRCAVHGHHRTGLLSVRSLHKRHSRRLSERRDRRRRRAPVTRRARDRTAGSRDRAAHLPALGTGARREGDCEAVERRRRDLPAGAPGPIALVVAVVGLGSAPATDLPRRDRLGADGET
jgi:hypothetical protein